MSEKRTVFGDKWSVIEPAIGKGQFGCVYKIVRTDFSFEEAAAMKEINIDINSGDFDDEFVFGSGNINSRDDLCRNICEKLLDEVKIMSLLAGNTNIVGYQDYEVEKISDGTRVFRIRMELLSSLKNYIKNKELSEEQVTDIGIQLSTALELCKKHNIIHRDIKPENIFISDDGSVKLGDFGVSKILLDELKTTGTQVGSPKTMAPEVFFGKDYDSRADQYSLGMVMYYLLNNNRYCGEIRSSEDAVLMPENVSPELFEIISKSISYYPDDRYPTITDFKKALEDFSLCRNEDKNAKKEEKKHKKKAASGKKSRKKLSLKQKIAAGLAAAVLVSAACVSALVLNFRNQSSYSFSVDGETLTENDIKKINSSGCSELILRNCGLTDEDLKKINFNDLDISTLDISGNITVTSLGFLSECSSLKSITLDDTGIVSLKCLDKLIYLAEISADNCSISSLDGLENTTLIESASFDNNPDLNDISILSQSSDTLKEVSFSGCSVNDISALSVCEKLVSVIADDNAIDNLSPMESKENLVRISAENNILNQFTLCDSCPKLRFISIGGNKIENLSIDSQVEGICLSFPNSGASVKLKGSFSKLDLRGSKEIIFDGVSSYSLSYIIIDYSDELDYDTINLFSDVYITNVPLKDQVALEKKFSGYKLNVTTDEQMKDKVHNEIKNEYIFVS